jgi:hypothetical protein
MGEVAELADAAEEKPAQQLALKNQGSSCSLN